MALPIGMVQAISSASVRKRTTEDSNMPSCWPRTAAAAYFDPLATAQRMKYWLADSQR